jgi:DNA polymerase III alpha subunit
MKILTVHTEEKLLDMKEYILPKTHNIRLGIPTIHRPIPAKNGKIDFDIYDYNMLFNDPGTKKIIREGNTIGCFYIESPGMRSLLKRLDCETFEMLTAASSVIRPGVAESGMMQEFIARHKDPSRRKYLLPEMETYLGETYGVMIYQEDVIKVAHHIAGLTLEEADLLRRAMSGKLRSHDAMKRISDKFHFSCREKGYSEKTTGELWRQIESFAGYAFCKAHSASFALLSFQVAYLKVHYPAEFMASVLSNRGGYYSAAVYIQECKRMGLKVLLPNVNKSVYEYEGRGRTLQIGLMAIKNLACVTMDKIVDERKTNGKYMSLADFLVRTRTGYEETKILIKCGAMDCFKLTRPSLVRLLDVYLSRRKILDENYNDLFASETFALEKEVITKRQYSLSEICGIEYESFGYMATRHPLHFFHHFVEHSKVVKAVDMYKHNGRKVRMVGWFMTSKRIKTKKGEIMKFLSLEDLTGTFEAVLFPRAYAEYAEQTLSMGPYLLLGTVDMENGHNLVVEKLAVLSAKEVASIMQKDSAENNWFGDVEKISEDEFYLVESLNAEKLRQAYCG